MLLIVCCVNLVLELILHTLISIFIRMKERENILIKFGIKVRAIRKEKGLSQEQLSFKANLHRTYIGMIERAERNISLVNIEKIAHALEVDIDYLLKF